ncbi:MAG: branched-chain amino acid ABC transporter permease [Deltaproteobacteria bacterium]|jgi:branched-chain amino acid transport system permease protein|nr:branched-chain amino acid ABC transporter permease [Deltaproteobacteria bacterium]
MSADYSSGAPEAAVSVGGDIPGVPGGRRAPDVDNNDSGGGRAFAAPARHPVWRAAGLLGFSPLGVVVVVVCLPLLMLVDNEYWIKTLTTALMYGALAMAFDFTSGYIGIVNFGFAAFMGLGAYVTGCLCWHLGWTPWQGLVPAVFAAAVLGLLLGLLTIRLGGIFAACMTWFAAMAMLSATSNWVSLTRGATGLTIPLLFKSAANFPYLVTMLVMALVSYLVLSLFVRSKAGLAFQAIGQDQEAASISGVDSNYYKVLNFTISCAFAGFVGWFCAHYVGVLTPQVLHTRATVEIMVISYIGGRGSLWGGLVAALIIVPTMEQVKSIQALSEIMELRLLLYGLLMILVMIYYPGGLSELFKTVVRRVGLGGWAVAHKK